LIESIYGNQTKNASCALYNTSAKRSSPATTRRATRRGYVNSSDSDSDSGTNGSNITASRVIVFKYIIKEASSYSCSYTSRIVMETTITMDTSHWYCFFTISELLFLALGYTFDML
jgi:hypothetical protein